jgi:hypothetical protein
MSENASLKLKSTSNALSIAEKLTPQSLKAESESR